MRIIAIDWGIKGMGISISDPLKITAQPLINYFFNKKYNYPEALAVIEKIIRDYNNEIEKIIVGYPLTLSGNKSSQTLEVEEFTNNLKEHNFDNCKINISLYDERLTTKIAKSRFGNRKDWSVKKDMYSSQILLEEYMSNLVNN